MSLGLSFQNSCLARFRLQKGAALLMLVFALSLVLLTYTVKSLNANNLQAKQNEKTFRVLSEAKAALISWSVSHPYMPGLMPYPDRNTDVGGYDGLSDCPGGATLTSHLIGQLPWKGGDYNDCNNLLGGLGKEFKDGSNEHLWYAVSKNLVHIYSPSGDPVINPSVIDAPPYGNWLTVYDKNGQLISNKVAVVIIAPGSPTDDQDRSSGGASNYLDSFYLQAGGGIKSNRTYATIDEDFYIGEDSRGVRSDNTTYQQPYYFNDKMVYITIDELMAEVEKRVAGEVRHSLNAYKSTYGYFPYAAAMGSVTNPNQCVSQNTKGLLPTSSTPANYTCSCSGVRTDSNCSCNYAVASTSISFQRRGTATFNNSTGFCTRTNSNRACACTGEGYCGTTAAATVRFTCTACGVCSTTVRGTYTISSVAASFTNPTTTGLGTAVAVNTPNTSFSATMDNTAAQGNGTVTATVAACASTQSLNSLLVTTQPWFTLNNWQDYIYYAVSSNCVSGGSNCSTATPQLTVGSISGIQALLISGSKPITSTPYAVSKNATQSARPSCDIKDYLDSANNTNEDFIYDAMNTARSKLYNDQMFIVAPK